jgi:AraC-like DNA-binding protein
MLLVNELEQVCVYDEGRVEQLFLNLRLPDPAGELPRGIKRLEPDGALGALTFGWVRDICLAALELPAGLADDIGQMLSDLLTQALAAPTTRARLPGAGIDVRAIETYIEHRLKDPCLSLPRIAQAFGCSVRTLQRAFSRPGAPSLGRYLWRRRVEACAEILRAPSAASRSLSDIALDLGFSSAAHFSTMFRGVFGVTPGQYRRGVQEPSRSVMALPPLQAA